MTFRLLSLQLYGIILIKFYRRKRMIREAKRKHGVSYRDCKRTDSDLNLAMKLQTENQTNSPCMQLGRYISKSLLQILYLNFFMLKIDKEIT